MSVVQAALLGLTAILFAAQLKPLKPEYAVYLSRRLLRDPDAGKKASRQKGLHTDADHIKSRLRKLTGAKYPEESGTCRPAQG